MKVVLADSMAYFLEIVWCECLLHRSIIPAATVPVMVTMIIKESSKIGIREDLFRCLRLAQGHTSCPFFGLSSIISGIAACNGHLNGVFHDST